MLRMEVLLDLNFQSMKNYRIKILYKRKNNLYFGVDFKIHKK